jgi:signal transduction histidine kinase
VLIGGALFERSRNEGVAFVLDLTERKRAEEKLRALESAFAHMNRVSMMGELAASLAHEVMQPIASARNNTRAACNFLDNRPSALGEVREALRCGVGDIDRASDIVERIRASLTDDEKAQLTALEAEVDALEQEVAERDLEIAAEEKKARRATLFGAGSQSVGPVLATVVRDRRAQHAGEWGHGSAPRRGACEFSAEPGAVGRGRFGPDRIPRADLVAGLRRQ